MFSRGKKSHVQQKYKVTSRSLNCDSAVWRPRSGAGTNQEPCIQTRGDVANFRSTLYGRGGWTHGLSCPAGICSLKLRCLCSPRDSRRLLPYPAPLAHSLLSQCPEQVICKSEHRPVKKISADHLNAGRDVLNTQLDRFSSSWRNSVPNGHRECYSPRQDTSTALRWPQTARNGDFC